MRKTALILCVSAFIASSLLADSIQHEPPALITSGSVFMLEFEPAGIAGAPLSVELYYRTTDLQEWVVLDLMGHWNNECLEVNLEPLPAGTHFFEYYLKLVTAEGTTITDPEFAPQTAVHRVDVQSPTPLTGEPVALMTPLNYTDDEQVLIAISLQEPVPAADLEITLEGEDITQYCQIDPWIITYLPDPDQPQQGQLIVKVRRTAAETDSWFLGAIAVKPRSWGFKLQANTFETIHFEQVAERWENYHRFGGNLTWSKGSQKLELHLNLAVKDWQDEQLQPQSRFSLKYSVPMLTVAAGDVYPRLNQLVLHSTRVRGGEIDFHSPFFSLQAVGGNLRQEILDDNDVALAMQRTMWAVSPRFGNYRKVSTGLILMKAWDVEVDSSNVHPQENLVLGADFTMRLLRERLLWSTEAAFSLSNTNTSAAVLSDADLDTLDWNWPSFLPTPESLEGFFTVNPYISPTNPLDLTSLAYQSRLQLNLPGNILTLRWRHLGSDFESFGSGGAVNDLEGFEIADGFSFLQRQYYIHLAANSYTDNLNGSLDDTWSTTRNSSLQGNISWYPVQDWPTLHFSGQFTKRQNDVDSDSEYYTNLTGNHLNLRVDHRFDWIGYKHRFNTQVTRYSLVDDMPGEDEKSSALSSISPTVASGGVINSGSSSWQWASTVRTELSRRLNNRIYLSLSSTDYAAGDQRSCLRLQDKIRWRWLQNLDLNGALGVRMINGDSDSYLRWRLQGSANWIWRRDYSFRMQLQQVFYTGTEDLKPDFRLLLHFEQRLFTR